MGYPLVAKLLFTTVQFYYFTSDTAKVYLEYPNYNTSENVMT